MRAYSSYGSNESGTASKTLMTIIGGASVRARLYHLIVGNKQAPADTYVEIAVRRFTAVGTSAGSPPTPAPLDSADAAAVATVGHAHSAEPTYATGQILPIYMNQRHTFQWYAQPGHEITHPLTANNGVGIQLISTNSAGIIMSAVSSWYE